MCILYESIISLCEEKGIKGGKMCVDLGLSKSLMTDLKAGRKKSIHAKTAQKIADYFNVSVDRVLGSELKEKHIANDDELLDNELISRLCQLTQDELVKVDAFVQGILASR